VVVIRVHRHPADLETIRHIPIVVIDQQDYHLLILAWVTHLTRPVQHGRIHHIHDVKQHVGALIQYTAAFTFFDVLTRSYNCGEIVAKL